LSAAKAAGRRQDRRDHVGAGVAAEGPRPGEHLEQNRAEGEDVERWSAGLPLSCSGDM